MRIAVIGTGHIGGALGGKFAAAGHQVVYGSRRAEGEGPADAPIRAVGDALADAEVVVLAVPARAVPDLIAEHGAKLAGTIVIDAVNRIGEPETNSRTLIAQAAPTALYARAFNTLGWENFADPLPGAALFFAADPGARPVVQELITVVGLHPEYVGGADASGTVDGLVPLWFSLTQQHGGNRRLALRVVE
jgi:8-hydroxy-5-deazaflavin:NADPH oxidoreductase